VKIATSSTGRGSQQLRPIEPAVEHPVPQTPPPAQPDRASSAVEALQACREPVWQTRLRNLFNG